MRTGPKIRLPASSYEERCAARERATAKPQETIADFKHRIALLMRNKEGGKQYSIIGAARPDPCVIRPKKPLANAKSDGILTAMTKKHFIAMADAMRRAKPEHSGSYDDGTTVGMMNERLAQWEHDVRALADFCASQNPHFNRFRWLGYIAGKCGSGGGAIKTHPRTGMEQAA